MLIGAKCERSVPLGRRKQEAGSQWLMIVACALVSLANPVGATLSLGLASVAKSGTMASPALTESGIVVASIDSGSYGFVCGHVNQESASSICRLLGYSGDYGATMANTTRISSSIPFVAQDLYCPLWATTASDCTYTSSTECTDESSPWLLCDVVPKTALGIGLALSADDFNFPSPQDSAGFLLARFYTG